MRNTSKQSGELAIKLKNNKTLRNLMFTMIIAFALMWIVDNIFDKAVSEWFSSQFVITYFNDYGYEQRDVNWLSIREFFVTAATIAVLIGYFLCHVYIAYFIRKEKADLNNQIVSCLKQPDQIKLPDGYAKIETELLKLQMEYHRQSELYQKEMERKNDLITYLAHDLKTPLASVIGYLSFLSEAQDLPLAQRQKYTDISLNKAYRLESLIDQFFDITRFNLQSIVIQKERVNIRIMLEQLIDEFYPLVQKKQGSIRLELHDEQDLYVDPDKFGRVLNNVMKNAVAYCYKETEIVVYEEIKDEVLTIRIENLGDEISETKLSMIFEKFFRMDEARSSQKGGAGLGLAIAKEIVEAHQGSITATSTKELTIFTIQIPIA